MSGEVIQSVLEHLNKTSAHCSITKSVLWTTPGTKTPEFIEQRYSVQLQKVSSDSLIGNEPIGPIKGVYKTLTIRSDGSVIMVQYPVVRQANINDPKFIEQVDDFFSMSNPFLGDNPNEF